MAHGWLSRSPEFLSYFFQKTQDSSSLGLKDIQWLMFWMFGYSIKLASFHFPTIVSLVSTHSCIKLVSCISQRAKLKKASLCSYLSWYTSNKAEKLRNQCTRTENLTNKKKLTSNWHQIPVYPINRAQNLWLQHQVNSYFQFRTLFSLVAIRRLQYMCVSRRS